MEPKNAGANRRSWWNYFNVEQGFKQRQIVRLLLLSAINVGISTAAFVTFMDYELSSLRGGMPVLPGEPSLLRIAIVWAALMGGLGGLFALFTGVMMTHRMAGPIHGFKKELERIAQGQAPRPVAVRSGDEFGDVAEALNHALDALYDRDDAVPESGALALDLEELRTTHREILDGIDAFDGAGLSESDQARLSDWRTQMRTLAEKLES